MLEKYLNAYPNLQSLKKNVSLTKRLTHENLEDTEDMEVVQETSLAISSQISNETVLESEGKRKRIKEKTTGSNRRNTKYFTRACI